MLGDIMDEMTPCRVLNINYQPKEVFYFKVIVQDLCMHNFYLTLLIYWNAIGTICKLGHTCLKINQPKPIHGITL